MNKIVIPNRWQALVSQHVLLHVHRKVIKRSYSFHYFSPESNLNFKDTGINIATAVTGLAWGLTSKVNARKHSQGVPLIYFPEIRQEIVIKNSVNLKDY